jgi:hypothetical protein
MIRYRIMFRVEDDAGRHVVRDRQIAFTGSDDRLYGHLTGALLIMAKIIKQALKPEEVTDATPRA